MHDSLNVLLKLILPEAIEEYFELTETKKDGDIIHLHLRELNRTLVEYCSNRPPKAVIRTIHRIHSLENIDDKVFCREGISLYNVNTYLWIRKSNNHDDQYSENRTN